MSWSSVGPSVCPLDAIFLLSLLQPLWLFVPHEAKESLFTLPTWFRHYCLFLLSQFSFSRSPSYLTFPLSVRSALPTSILLFPPFATLWKIASRDITERTVKKHNNIYSSVCWPSCDQVIHLGGGAVAEIVVGDKAVANDDWSPQLLRCILTNKQTSQNFCLCLNTSGR